MTIETIPAEVIELACEHLSVDADDLNWEFGTRTREEIEKGWNEASRDLSHLSREDRSKVLQRSLAFRPQVIEGVNVTLYNDVQVRKGQSRVSAVIIDSGDNRFVALS